MEQVMRARVGRRAVQVVPPGPPALNTREAVGAMAAVAATGSGTKSSARRAWLPRHHPKVPHRYLWVSAVVVLLHAAVAAVARCC